jgi:hypothetical protein
VNVASLRKRVFIECDEVKIGHYGLEWALNSVSGVLIRRAYEDRQQKPRGDGGKEC